MHAENTPILSLSQSEVKHISCVNFTAAHFEEGATKFTDLKPEAFKLFCSLTNALGHCTDKKKNPRSVTASPLAAASTGTNLAALHWWREERDPRSASPASVANERKRPELQEESTDDMDGDDDGDEGEALSQ